MPWQAKWLIYKPECKWRSRHSFGTTHATGVGCTGAPRQNSARGGSLWTNQTRYRCPWWRPLYISDAVRTRGQEYPKLIPGVSLRWGNTKVPKHDRRLTCCALVSNHRPLPLFTIRPRKAMGDWPPLSRPAADMTRCYADRSVQGCGMITGKPYGYVQAPSGSLTSPPYEPSRRSGTVCTK